jgi:tetraacyldisaccharide 4'-kinase
LILHVLSSVYAAAASWRRRWYTREPTRQRRLTQPVISVGNLRVGGTGKTPVVAHLVRLLIERGERPAILSRGYGRTGRTEGVTIVSNATTVLADLAAAGDEPLMLARALPGVPVLVGANRFECGGVAERQFDVTVHLLDDGFQHVTLARDVDLLLADESDLSDRVLPAGRLREPLANAAAADAVLVTSDDAAAVSRVAHTLNVSTAFHVVRAIHTPRSLDGQPVTMAGGARLLAFAGIARPERFFADLAASGWPPGDVMVFPDHHQYTQADVDRIAAHARSLDAAAVLTTEKDAVRLDGLDLKGLRVEAIPLTITVEPARQFSEWLCDRLRVARARAAERPRPGSPAQPAAAASNQ